MANESTASYVGEILPYSTPAGNKDILLLTYYTCLNGMLSNFYYGISDDNWIEIFEQIVNFNNDFNQHAGGRWSFQSSLSNDEFTQMLNDGLTLPIGHTPSVRLISENYITINKALSSLDLPTLNWSDDDAENILILKSVTRLLGQKIKSTNFQNIIDSSSDSITILKLNYDDREEGMDFLEVGGEYVLFFDCLDNYFDDVVSSGEIIQEPTITQLYEHNMCEYTPDEYVDEFNSIYHLEKNLSKLPENIKNELNESFKQELNDYKTQLDYALFSVNDDDEEVLYMFENVFTEITEKYNLDYPFKKFINRE